MTVCSFIMKIISEFEINNMILPPESIMPNNEVHFFSISIEARETVENKAQTEAVKEDTKISAEISTEKCLTEANPLHPALYQEDVFSRTLLLLSTAQLMQEKYPLPVQYSNGMSFEYRYARVVPL